MLTIGLSAVLIVTLIILFACIGENINLKMEVEELKIKNETLSLGYSSAYRDYVKLLMKLDALKPTTPDIKEAIYYAMIKAHPDNGGTSEDFIKYRNLYERINNGHK